MEYEYSSRLCAVCKGNSTLAITGEFYWPVRVYYEDTDSGGVVYYANYLKFMERARTEWLRSMGYDLATLAETRQLIFAVRRAELDYLRPARFNDRLEVGVHVVRCGGASIDLLQTTVRDGDEDERVMCSARIRIACLDRVTFKPRPLPDEMVEDIRQQMLKRDRNSSRQ